MIKRCGEFLPCALFLALAATSAEAAKQSLYQSDPNSTNAALNLDLDDSNLSQKEPASGGSSIQDRRFAELQAEKTPDDGSGDAGKFQLKPEFNFVDNDEGDYDPHVKGQGEELKLHLDYNF